MQRQGQRICGGSLHGRAGRVPDRGQVSSLAQPVKTVEKCALAHLRCLTPPQDEAQGAVVEPSVALPAIGGTRAANTRRHFAAVHEMYDKGVAIDVISKPLRMDRKVAGSVRQRAACSDATRLPDKQSSAAAR